MILALQKRMDNQGSMEIKQLQYLTSYMARSTMALLLSAPLKSPLEAGRYECTAIFYTYNMDTEEYIGQAAAEITLTLVQ